MMKEKPLLIIILIACVTRLFFLADFPKGFSGDEVQQGYSAYSILKTGRDEWGQFLPINPRGFGDFKPPIYTYLIVPSIAIFGLNETAVRMPAAVVGIFMVFIVYLLTLQILKDKQVALWAAFLLSISPWHIQISRTAFEGGVGVLFFSLGLLFFLKRLQLKNLILSASFWGLTLYTYHSYRVFIILFIVGLFFLSVSSRVLFNRKINLKKYGLIVAILFLFLIPLIINIKSTLVRSSDVSIFSKQQMEGYFINRGTSPLPPAIDKLFDNKFYYAFTNFYSNYLSYPSPYFFFTGHRPDNSYLNFPGFPLLYPFEIISFYLGLYLLFRKKEESFILLTWLLLAPISASLATGNMSANRAVTFLPVLTIISAFGVKNIIDYFNQKTFLKKNFSSNLLVSIICLSFIFFLYYYIVQLPKHTPASLRPEYKQVFQKILQNQPNFDQIVISKALSQPQIFIAFYSKYDPIKYQQASQDWLRYEKADKLYIDQLESWNLDNFYFEDLNWQMKDSKRPNALIVGRAEDFPTGFKSIYDFKDTKGNTIYRLVSTK